MKPINALGLLGAILLVLGCHNTRADLNALCCTRIETVIASPNNHFGSVITVRGKLIYNGYMYLSSLSEREDLGSSQMIEISVDDAVRLVAADRFFELDSSCVVVRGIFLAATEHSLEAAGRLTELTRLEVASDCGGKD